MATKGAVLSSLRKKLAKPGEAPVSLQAIHQRRARLQALVPMPTDIATYVLAQRAGVPLHRHLDSAALDQVAIAEQRLKSSEAASGTTATSQRGKERLMKPAVVKELHLGTMKMPLAMLSEARKAEAQRMAAVYSLLYVFENSVREFVDGHLTARLGNEWFNESKVVSSSIRRTVERNRAAEGQSRYHSRRNARPIFYTNLSDLTTITSSEVGWPIFKPLFPSDRWLGALIEKIETSRNVVAHMNPIQKRDVDRLKINLEDWVAQIDGHPPPVVS